MIKLTPDTKISDNQTNISKIVWPRSGWEIKSNTTGIINIKLIKKRKYKLLILLYVKIKLKNITKKGFISSIGWNLGRKAKSIHRFEPFTSTPKIGTKNKNINEIIKKKIEKLINFFWFIMERVISIPNPNIINKKCFTKK